MRVRVDQPGKQRDVAKIAYRTRSAGPTHGGNPRSGQLHDAIANRRSVDRHHVAGS
jgi:hypothetical protein